MGKFAVEYSQGDKKFQTNVVASEYKEAAIMVHAMAMKNGYEIKSVRDSKDI